MLLHDLIRRDKEIIDTPQSKISGGLIDHLFYCDRFQSVLESCMKYIAELAQSLASQQYGQYTELTLFLRQSACLWDFTLGKICNDPDELRIRPYNLLSWLSKYSFLIRFSVIFFH